MHCCLWHRKQQATVHCARLRQPCRCCAAPGTCTACSRARCSKRTHLLAAQRCQLRCTAISHASRRPLGVAEQHTVARCLLCMTKSAVSLLCSINAPGQGAASAAHLLAAHHRLPMLRHPPLTQISRPLLDAAPQLLPIGPPAGPDVPKTWGRLICQLTPRGL